MLPNSKAKYIKSLQIKKYRNKHRSFLVEGAKNMIELLNSDYEIECLVVSEDFHKNHLPGISNVSCEMYIEKKEKIDSLSTLKTNEAGLAVVKMSPEKELVVEKEIILVLDDVRDPGNLGTIIRTADWFGIKKIVASEESAELYNPKVIQASMGSFTRIEVFYLDLPEFFKRRQIETLGAFLDGESIHTVKFDLPVAVVMGNESRGISERVKKYISQKITIPKYGAAESLNVAMSTAIICDNLRRVLKSPVIS